MKKFSIGNSMPMIIGVVAILVIAVGAFYFMNMATPTDESVMVTDQPSANNDVMESDPMDSDDTMMEEDVVTFEINASNFEFSVDELEVEEGQTVRIVLSNTEGMHDFVIDEFDAATSVIEEGETDTIEFVADQTGEFEYYCSVGNHRAQGMVGTLTVVEATQE